MDQVASLSFGALLKGLRRARGRSQEYLAAQAGYSVAYISMLERGERAPISTTAELLAAALVLADNERATFLQAAQVALERRRAGRRGRGVRKPDEPRRTLYSSRRPQKIGA